MLAVRRHADTSSLSGSEEEVADLREAYVKCEGSIEGILGEIPHSNHEDEARFIAILKPLIKKKDLPKFPAWEADVKDVKGRERRKKEGEKEAKEAEEHAKELGVWDEFYGTGKEGPRKAKGKAKAEEEVDESALQAIILRKKAERGSIFDNLLAKYGGADASGPKKKSSKRKPKDDDEEDEEELNPSPKKRSKATTSSTRASSRKKVHKTR